MNKMVPTVLVVDDDQTVIRAVRDELAPLPFVVIPTNSPSEAMHIIKTREISVLICDINMPTINDMTVLRIARDHNPNTVAILSSSTSDAQLIAKALNEGGIWRYIAKPWMQIEIINAVSEAAKLYNVRCHQQAELVKLAHDETQRIGRVSEPEDGPFIFEDDRYELINVIGKGGAGHVYKAKDTLLDMTVALKLLSSSYTHNSPAVARLKKEARIAMQLSHRHIVRIHNLQKANDHYFIVMEYVEGRTFRDILRAHGPLPLETVVQILRVSTEALSYAHRRDVVHKDLKPSNLMLSEDGVLKIIDFGIAGMANLQEDSDTVFGTPVYMSPEQIHGESLDLRTDVYAMGIITYELLTANRPFPDEEEDLRVYAEGPKDPPGLPIEIAPVLKMATAPDRANRWPSMHAFSRAFADSAGPLLS